MDRQVLFGGHPVGLLGKETLIGELAPDFTAVRQDLSTYDFYDETAEKIVVISTAPSLDTGICSLQAQRFNDEATALGEDVVILQISMDLPFAQKRFCAAEGVDAIEVVSDHREASFGMEYGFLMEGFRLLARGIVVIDRSRRVRYVELVPEVKTHPDYDSALQAVKELLET